MKNMRICIFFYFLSTMHYQSFISRLVCKLAKLEAIFIFCCCHIVWLVNIEVPIFVCILGPSIICLLQEEQCCADENYHLGISHPDRKNITPKHAKTTKQYDNKRKMNKHSFVKSRKCLIVIFLYLRKDKTGKKKYTYQ